MCFYQIGGEIQYGITDVVVMVREVADHQDILRFQQTVIEHLIVSNFQFKVW